MIGQTLRHYRIEAKLGQGGMGVVYRALDTHLNRPVAVKVLTPEAVADPELRQRFMQEARTASALNHPNIITIYDIDKADSVTFIAMEYVAGKTLHELIAGQGLAIKEALRYAVQITDALATAHAAGIVHRDLKPANIMVTDQGLVKVLDFGLAKLTETEEYDQNAPTRSFQVGEPARTEKGIVVGTANYMSPEQAASRKVDGRSDIFSFGSVLYEMITGRRAFQGDNKISTLSAILHLEPEAIAGAAEGPPRELEKLIARCLRKDPEYRFQHMDDLKVALRELREESELGRPAVSSGLMRTARMVQEKHVPLSTVLILALGLVVAIGFGTWWWTQSHTAGTHPELILTRLTTDSGLSTDPAISPDGKLVVYASDRAGAGNLSLWLRQVGGGDPIRLTTNAADDRQPSFSPDGTQIAFRSERDGGGVYVVSALGGEPRLIARHGHNPRFSPDGKWIAYWVGEAQASSRLYLAAAAGGPAQELKFQPEIGQSRYPVWSPDGKSLLFLGREIAHVAGGLQRQEYDWWVASIESKTAARTGAFGVFKRQGLVTSYSLAPGQWAGDQILFSTGLEEQGSDRKYFLIYNFVILNDNASLWRVPIASNSGRITGPAVRLTSGTSLDTKPSAASSGALVFSSIFENIDVWSLPVDANQAAVRGEPQRLTQDPAPETYPSVSADGKSIAFFSTRSGNADIWMKDLESGRETRLTQDQAYETFPMMTPDRSKVAYQVLENEKRRLFYVLSLSPEGKPGLATKACEDCGNLSDRSSDGSKLLYYDDPTQGATLVDTASGLKTQILKHPKYYVADPRLSADDGWVAFHAIVSPVGRQIFIAPLRKDEATPVTDWIPITDGLGMDRLPAWSPNGNTVYFISERDGFRCIYARRLQPATKQPDGPVFDVYHFHTARRSMMSLININMSRMSVARDKIVFSLCERTGNVWMGRPEK